MQQRGSGLAALVSALVLASANVLGGCDRRTEAFRAAEDEPPAPATPVQIPSLAQTRVPPRFGGGAMAAPPRGSAEPVSQGTGSAPAAAEEGKEIQGTIRLGDGVKAPDQGVLFVIARVTGMRPPIAVVRLPVGPFPQQFSIGPKDRVAMMGSNVPFEGAIELSARVDLDGNAMTRDAGGIGGSAGEVQAGSKGVEIVLGAEGGN